MKTAIALPVRNFFMLAILLSAAVVAEQKHHEDPTRIVTKLGAGYTDSASISGSVGIDEARMLSARVSEEGEWRIGGSWLFDLGIVNFNFNRVDYDNDGYRNNYSIGTYVPLSYFEVPTGNWLLFPMAGYSYNEGEMALPSQEPGQEFIMMRNKSHGGYLGMFGVRPIEHSNWSVLGFAGGSAGSNSYLGYWGGLGLSYNIDQNMSFNVFGIVSEDNYGNNNRVGGSFTYQF